MDLQLHCRYIVFCCMQSPHEGSVGRLHVEVMHMHMWGYGDRTADTYLWTLMRCNGSRVVAKVGYIIFLSFQHK